MGNCGVGALHFGDDSFCKSRVHCFYGGKFVYLLHCCVPFFGSPTQGEHCSESVEENVKNGLFVEVFS